MITSKNTETRILDLMRKGAKLVYHIAGSGEFTFVSKITLQRHDNELTLAVVERWTSDGEPFSAYNEALERIRKSPDVHRGYLGYQSPFAHIYREAYEHRDAPVKQWITEQWASPMSQYEDS